MGSIHISANSLLTPDIRGKYSPYDYFRIIRQGNGFLKIENPKVYQGLFLAENENPKSIPGAFLAENYTPKVYQRVNFETLNILTPLSLYPLSAPLLGPWLGPASSFLFFHIHMTNMYFQILLEISCRRIWRHLFSRTSEELFQLLRGCPRILDSFDLAQCFGPPLPTHFGLQPS